MVIETILTAMNKSERVMQLLSVSIRHMRRERQSKQAQDVGIKYNEKKNIESQCTSDEMLIGISR